MRAVEKSQRQEKLQFLAIIPETALWRGHFDWRGMGRHSRPKCLILGQFLFLPCWAGTSGEVRVNERASGEVGSQQSPPLLWQQICQQGPLPGRTLSSFILLIPSLHSFIHFIKAEWNIATVKMSQAITSFHFFGYFNLFYWFHKLTFITGKTGESCETAKTGNY